jgi:hypothetical protein
MLAFAGGELNYALMALEAAAMARLIIERPLFQRRKSERESGT